MCTISLRDTHETAAGGFATYSRRGHELLRAVALPVPPPRVPGGCGTLPIPHPNTPHPMGVAEPMPGAMEVRVNGIHDLGGMHGLGRIDRSDEREGFHEGWEGRVFAMVLLLTGAGVYTPDAFRFGIESLDARAYLTAGYYGRWLASLERQVVERGVTTSAELDTRRHCLASGRKAEPAVPYAPPAPGTFRVDARRDLGSKPLFTPGQVVRARNINPAGHTRLPRYVRGKAGEVRSPWGEWVFPDTNAVGLGEQPQHVYCVRFEGSELWGPDAEPGTSVSLDLFEPYLEPA
jgi:nitrile hydratase beta subunit